MFGVSMKLFDVNAELFLMHLCKPVYQKGTAMRNRPYLNMVHCSWIQTAEGESQFWTKDTKQRAMEIEKDFRSLTLPKSL